MEVKVVGFDAATKQAIVRRLPLDDIKKVSRLSIHFNDDPHSLAKYWKRVNQAKYYERRAHEHTKYERYIFARP
jgi:hypothetical protein